MALATRSAHASLAPPHLPYSTTHHAHQHAVTRPQPANVLLRSSATDPRGFNAKLADFGFVNVLEVQQQEDELAGLSVVGSAALKAGGGGSGGGAGEVLEAVPPPRSGDAARDVAACAPKMSLKSFEPVGTVTHMVGGCTAAVV